MNPAIEHALDDWRKLNAESQWWAEFEAIQFDSALVVRVTCGVRHSNGFKETALTTAHYHVNAAGEVEVTT